MRPLFLIVLTLLLLSAPSFAQSVSLQRMSSSPIEAGSEIEISVRMETAAGMPVRGGGVEVTFPDEIFTLLDGGNPAAVGDVSGAVAIEQVSNPFRGATPPAWLTASAGSSALQLRIVPEEASLGDASEYTGSVATYRLRVNAVTTNAPLAITDRSRIVPGGTTSRRGLLLTIGPGESPSAPSIRTVVPQIGVPEDETRSIGVFLSEAPASPVTVVFALEPGDPDLTLPAGQSLTFDASNFSEPQDVQVAATRDDDFESGEGLLRCSTDGYTSTWVLLTELDASAPEGNFAVTR